jgi:putative FmdB family regulatory protein
MPRYPFRCTVCALEFEVSRSIHDPATGASCPADGAAAERIFTVPQMIFGRPEAPPTPTPPRGGGGFSHHGHSHGPGTAGHSH